MTAAHPGITIRPETPADIQPIARLLDAAFGGAAESRLVEALRADGDLALSLIAEDAGGIVGHLALSPVAAPFPALALAPLAVTPGRQRRGIGAALVAAAQARRPDATIIVLGDPPITAASAFARSAGTARFPAPICRRRGRICRRRRGWSMPRPSPASFRRNRARRTAPPRFPRVRGCAGARA